jgi:integrase
MTLKAVRALFAEAERLEVIRRNPAARVGAFAKNSRERGVLSQEELDKLFSFNALETVWGGQTTPYLLAMMAVGCGLRRGEAIALRPKDFTGTTILVSRSWNDHAGEFTAPKWGSMREVPAPPRIQEELTAYIEAHELEQDALLFPGEDPSRPVHHKPVMQALRDALSAIGISEAEQSRERRFLDFHALRHTYITRLRSGDVPDWQIQRAAGHRSLAMTDHYTHASGSDLHDVAAARILPFSKGA